MRPNSHTASGLRWALLVTAVLIVLGHVCVVPNAVHALEAAAEGHDAEDSHDAVHGASCEAMPAAPPAGGLAHDAPNNGTPQPLVPLVSASAIRAVVVERDHIAGIGPPKFLLHLLI